MLDLFVEERRVARPTVNEDQMFSRSVFFVIEPATVRSCEICHSGPPSRNVAALCANKKTATTQILGIVTAVIPVIFIQ
jgi:hypothetical protein